MKQLKAALTACLLGLTWAFVPCAMAQYPEKPIRIIVPFPPGGGADIITRIVTQKLTERWGGKQFIVDYRPGADTQIGTQVVAKAAPDGYTFLITSSAFAVNHSLYPGLPYDSIRDFTPIAPLVRTSYFLVVNPNVEANSVRDLIALAKRDPGKLNYSSSSSLTYLGGEMFKSMAGIDVTNVPYKGSVASLLAVMTGDVAYTFETYLLAKPYIEAGKLRLIGVSGKNRSPDAPSVPTMAEAGVSGFDTSAWWGMFGPAGVPADIVAKLNGELKAVLALPDVKERFEKLGVTPLYDTPENFSAFVKSELKKYETVVKTNKLKPAQ